MYPRDGILFLFPSSFSLAIKTHAAKKDDGGGLTHRRLGRRSQTFLPEMSDARKMYDDVLSSSSRDEVRPLRLGGRVSMRLYDVFEMKILIGGICRSR